MRKVFARPSAARDGFLALLTLALIVAVSARFPRFASPGSLADVLDDTSILILLAFGQMLVILTRGIDLSMASNLALSGMVAALFNRTFPELSTAAPIALAVLSGTLLGAFNGVLVWQLRLPSIVVTLGTLSIYRGMVYVLSKGTWVNSNQMSQPFLQLVRAHFTGLSALTWLAIAAALCAAFVLRYTVFGRNVFAVGGNPQAAAYAGIDAGRVQCLAFTVSGALAGLCGYLWVSRFAVAYTDVAIGFELQVIAACLIGGASIAGGTGSALGVLIGCLFLGVIKNALPLIGISPFWQMGINGVVITIAAILNARGERTVKRAILEAEPV